MAKQIHYYPRKSKHRHTLTTKVIENQKFPQWFEGADNPSQTLGNPASQPTYDQITKTTLVTF